MTRSTATRRPATRPRHDEQLSAARQNRLTAMLALVGVAGHALAAAVAWLLPAASEYTLVGDNISELVLGRFGFLQTIAFVAAGGATLAVASCVRRTTRRIRGSLLGALLVGVFGVGALLEAFLPTDRISSPEDLSSLSPVGAAHLAVAAVSFLAQILGMAVLSMTFRRSPAWAPLWPVTVVLAIAALLLMLGQGEGPLVGLLQRVLVATVSGWLVLVAWRARALARRGAGPTAATEPLAAAAAS